MDMDFAAKRKISMLDLQWMMRASDADILSILPITI